MRLLTITIILIILCIIIYVSKTKEGFYIMDQGYCGDCGKRGRFNCGKCMDCGYCVRPDGHGTCVPGDAKGPYFAEDCLNWEFSAPWTTEYIPKYHKTLSYGPYNYQLPLTLSTALQYSLV